MHGNFASSAAILRTLEPRLSAFSDGQWLASCLCSPSLIGLAIQAANLNLATQAFLENLNYFLTTGLQAGDSGLISDFEKLMLIPRRNSEIVTLRSARLALQQLIELSIARLSTKAVINLPREFIDKLIEDQKYTLLPSQMHVLGNPDFHYRNNALITLPTSAGKTLIAEFALISALADGPGICFYIVPYIALGKPGCPISTKTRTSRCSNTLSLWCIQEEHASRTLVTERNRGRDARKI
jgi:helicase